ncbi:hypothetical protein CEXT_543371 [Caerostris extrusa]|uniref:Uncharacterized protein n=1 Tax=Caerostris extrusa TaxID=172846 RepID=A0AAV4VRI4_CAEEX|nr:hypothetical protein CEXT_543371 [Caerostris extrusa]
MSNAFNKSFFCEENPNCALSIRYKITQILNNNPKQSPRRFSRMEAARLVSSNKRSQKSFHHSYSFCWKSSVKLFANIVSIAIEKLSLHLGLSGGDTSYLAEEIDLGKLLGDKMGMNDSSLFLFFFFCVYFICPK